MSNRTKLNEAEALLVDLSKPDLRTLAVVLRNRELWPVGFEWNYGSCCRCAMGMAHLLWNEIVPKPGLFRTTLVGESLGMNEDDSYRVFMDTDRPNKCRMEDVTPEMVADQIDAVLAEGG